MWAQLFRGAMFLCECVVGVGHRLHRRSGLLAKTIELQRLFALMDLM